MTKKRTDDTDETMDPVTENSAAAQPTSDGQLVHLCDTSRRELFMLETPNQTNGQCDRCDATGTLLFQYPRADVRMEHLAKWDRDGFNAKLDALAAAAEEAQRARDDLDAAAKKRGEDAWAALVAKNDAAYQAAVTQRHLIEAAEAGSNSPTPTPNPPNIIISPATPATPSTEGGH